MEYNSKRVYAWAFENKENRTGIANKTPPIEPHESRSNRGLLVLGLVVVALGVFFLLVITIYGTFCALCGQYC